MQSQYPPYPPYQMPPMSTPKQKPTWRRLVTWIIIIVIGLVLLSGSMGQYLANLVWGWVVIGGLVWLIITIIKRANTSNKPPPENFLPDNSYQEVEPYQEQATTYNTYNYYNQCIIQQNFYYDSAGPGNTYIEEEYEEDENY